jgi:putative Mg2+ transporter-C (MgtC) family protein
MRSGYSSVLVPDIGLLDSLARLGLAAGLGAAIGFERELRDHEAGLRTHLLVSLGAALFTLVSAYAWTDWRVAGGEGVTFDPTRIAAQIVSGVGFLGAGAIIVRGASVKGLTTAASIWVVAAIGMASGAGFYGPAIGATVIVIVSLSPLRHVSRKALGRSRSSGRLHVEVENGGRSAVIEAVQAVCGSLQQIDVSDRSVTLYLQSSRDMTRALEVVADIKGVARVEWAA